ncbi:MAG: hypothetical protein HY216_15180 [Candidatus Rokubacteria bacterium]|nr:hypothetical protein [Candidatus Rokubacteria bacterium]
MFRVSGPLALAVLVVAAAARFVAERRAAPARRVLDRAALAALTATVVLLLADNAFILAERMTGRRHGDATADLDTRYLGLAVHRIFPTARNFQTYRPNVTASGWRYGDLASGRLLQDPRLVRLVLERRYVTYVIDEHGFRETTPLRQARILALGDSMTLGSTTQDKTWPKVLEARLGIPVYNLGVSAASPRQELHLLRYLFETKRDRLRIDRLVWMISEINDLEDSYTDEAPAGRDRRLSEGFVPAQFVLAIVKRLPAAVQERSLVHRLRTGDLRLGPPPQDTSAVPAYFFDGRRLPAPLYQSPVLGAKLFHPGYIENARRATTAYVARHPNRPRLEQTFREMAELARREVFSVMVVIAPGDVRLYAAHFHVAPMPAEPAVAELVTNVARANGFDVLDLTRELAPSAAREMLYYRDDTHWNERGNQLVAELLAESIARLRSPR